MIQTGAMIVVGLADDPKWEWTAFRVLNVSFYLENSGASTFGTKFQYVESTDEHLF